MTRKHPIQCLSLAEGTWWEGNLEGLAMTIGNSAERLIDYEAIKAKSNQISDLRRLHFSILISPVF